MDLLGKARGELFRGRTINASAHHETNQWLLTLLVERAQGLCLDLQPPQLK
jgi:hypothetical protein